METYARILNGVVMEVISISNTENIATMFHPALVWVACGSNVQQGWLYSAGIFSAPPPIVLTPAQEGQAAYSQAMAVGCQIASTSTPALNGTYPLDDSTLLKVVGEQNYIALKSTFTNGQTTRAWGDTSGTFHIFPATALFTAFGEALAAYIDALQTALAGTQAGGAWVAPAQPVTIP